MSGTRVYQMPSSLAADLLRPFILVVDDEKRIADTLALILDSEGYSAEAAYEGASALEICRRKVPDLILSDAVMPGMNGIELAIAVRQQFRTVTSCSSPARLTLRRYWKTPSAVATTSNSWPSLFTRKSC
jgi:CheY-like chemotaxis protein